MCKKCGSVDYNGKLIKPSVSIECSWCDKFVEVCPRGSELVLAGSLTRLCGHCHADFMCKSPLIFSVVLHRADQERDVDANGWLSNAINLLEEPEDR